MLTFEGSNPDYKIFMGDDKYENEELIAWGWPEDVWFHVDEVSSAHVYVRVPRGKTIKDLPAEVIDECCQLTKGNSIEGSKRPTVDIVCTPWANLKKEQSMDTGTIGFKNHRDVKKFRNVQRNRELLNALEKTRKQVRVNFQKARRERDSEEIAREKSERKAAALAAEKQEIADREAYRLKHYMDLKVDRNAEAEKGDGTIDDCRQLEEDFM